MEPRLFSQGHGAATTAKLIAILAVSVFTLPACDSGHIGALLI